ncbi:alpha-2-macroglobulin family protein [Azospira restricta]|uniref:Alpha-2-macroglobulin family protein n=1 Tax=Azospira restricta TaxID=404405 RepID=A0A974SRH9_9RHOO|nr:alpha-2-macroglobulin [Azospira restricta]QRJ65170.1 alpha-2-macroglobulin family protein [Azospira restricta]
MRFAAWIKQRGVAPVVAIVAVLAVAATGWFLASRLPAGGAPGELSSEGVAFEVVDAAHREFDGSPALALSFSLPLDARADVGQFVQVLEVPPLPGTLRPRVRSDDEDYDEDYSGHSDARLGSGVSRAPEDTRVDDGKPVAGAWTVGDNPRLLFFPHIKPSARYVVRVLPGLPAKSGATLAGGEQRFSVQTAAVAPAFYFASKGMVLPAAQNGGLPVSTVNVPEVDIQFLKVKTEQLPAFLEKVIAGAARPQRQQGEANAEGGDGEDECCYYYDRGTRLQGAVNGWTLDSFHKMTTSAFAGRFLTEQKPNRRSVTFIPVEGIPALQEPGVYIAVMSQPNRFRHEYQTTYYYVSDFGLHVRQYAGKGADAFVSSLSSGKGVGGVEISWLAADGKILGRAETDGDGRAHFAERPKDARVVVAKKGEQLSLIALKEPALDLAEFDIGGLTSAPVRLFAYSGRNLYRPGESFDVSVMARDADGRPVPPQPVQALLRRPDGKAQWTASWSPEEKFAGYYRKTIELPADAATGFWNLELRADPAAKVASTVMRIGVEEFLPEKMKLDLVSKAEQLAPESGWQIDVAGNYLYGAPAAGNKLLGVVNTERNKNPLEKKLPGFVFGDADEDSVRSRSELPESELDDEGKASVAVDLSPVHKRRSPFTVRATLSLLESGGRPVVRSIERTYWPAPVLVGLRPMFVGAYAREGSNAEFEVAVADAAANLKAGTALPVRIFRENRNWYWRFDDQRGWHSGYNETDELVATTQVSVPAGSRGKLLVPVKYGRYRVEVFNPETKLVTRYRFYAGWSAKDDETQGVRPDRVALKLDKPAYADGETAKLTITPPHAGEALITVEGDKLLWSRRLSVPVDGSTIDIPIAADWKRHDLYVTAMVLRPGSAGEKGGAGVTPARALGLAYLPLERGKRKLAVALDAPKKAVPDQPLKVKIKVPDAKGQQAMVTLSAVDVGILNITSFKSPDPHGFFFAKLRYGHDLYDVYGRLIESMAGQKGKLKWGGDAAPKPSKNLPKKVRLVDLFSGPVALDANGEAEVALPVPDFNGSLRLMAVAASGERFGMQEAEVTVAAPLVVELATPRFLSVGDSALLALDVHNLAGAEQEVKIKVGNGDGLVIRNGEQKLSLKDQQKRILRIPLEAGSAIGLTEVQVKIESPLMKLDRTFPLQVQAPTPRQTVLKRYTVNPGETLEVKEADLAGFLKQTVNATLSVSDKAPIDVRSAVQGLLTYPYGCAEQTTSTAYPHVFIDEAAAKQFGLKAYTQAQRAEMLDKAIGRLAGMQAPNGGFSLWGNVNEYQYWLSAYVTNFLLDAREQGFTVPAEMEKKAVDFLLTGLQQGVAGLPRGPVNYNENSVWNDWRYAGSGRFGVLAYGAYVLARQGKAPLATLRTLSDASEQAHSGLGLVHLGLALKLMGDEARSKAAIDAGLKKPRVGDRWYWWGDYGTPLRDWAQMYVLLQKHELAPEGRENLVGMVAGEIEKNRYISTQEKLSLFLLGRNFANQQTGDWAAELTLAGKAQGVGGKGTQFQSLAAGELATGVKLKNTHKERLFVELNYAGNPAKPPAARRDAFDIRREWYTADGKELGSRSLKVGETLIVRLNVKTKGRYANGLVVDYVPAGVEIENANIVQGEQNTVEIAKVDMRQAMQDTRIKHLEFRDDRFVVAARLEGEMNFFYRVRVVTPGKFVMPPTYAEDMYQPMVYGLAGGGETVVVGDGAK